MSPSATLLNSVLILCLCAALSAGLSCDSCGRECASACGTRNFRTCCFNYLKKRSTDSPPRSGVRLELLMVLPELVHHYPSLRNLLTPSQQLSPSASGLKLSYQDSKFQELFAGSQASENY